MKHTKHVLLMAAMLLGILSVNAYDFESNGIYYNVISGADKTVEVTSGDNKYAGEIVIPEKVTYGNSTLSVISIGDNAFSNCSDLSSVSIPEGVTMIGNSAFSYSGLSLIALPSSMTSIGNSAFYNCDNLVSITVPDAVTTIGSSTFYDCDNLTTIILDDGLTSIGNSAFYECSNLVTIELPANVTKIGSSAFEGCSSLTSITVPGGVKYISSYTFRYCNALESVVLGDGVESIGLLAFGECYSLSSITIPASLKTINWNAFRTSGGVAVHITDLEKWLNITMGNPPSASADAKPGGYPLNGGGSLFLNGELVTTLTIPNSVKSVKSYAFDGCSSITSLIIPDNVTSIGSGAFRNCENLTSIRYGNGLEYIGCYGASNLTSLYIGTGATTVGDFSSCTKLEYIHCMAPVPPTYALFPGIVSLLATLEVPSSSIEAYKTAEGWKEFANIIEDPSTIKTLVSSITLSETSLTLTGVGSWTTLVANVLPEDATDGSVTWSSSNPNVVAVAIDGGICAMAPGTATITATANDGSGVSASCEVAVVEATSYSLTFMVDGEIFQTETSETPIELVFPEAPEKEGYSFVRWELGSSDATLTDIDIANNADAMLYSNAPCTNTQYGDQFTSWDVLFDDDYTTFFHSEYSEGVDSEDGEHHYLRVDMGEGNAVSQFTFSYAMRGDQFPNHTPTEIIVEGSNEADGEYEVIAVLADLAAPPYDIDYTSDILGNGKSYRYIRYRVTETRMNSLVCGHPYFYISEFGMKKAQDCYNAVYHGVYAPNKYKVYYYVGEELLGYEEVTYGDNMPNMGYFPALDTEEFLGWISETGDTYETMPAHDVIYVANIRTYEKCATPTIRYADGRVTFSCETEGVEFRTQVIDDKRPIYRTDSDGFEFVPTYTFTTRATKEDCIDSDEVSITICWIDCTGEHENGNDDTGIISVPSQPVIIQCASGVITLTGLANGTAVAVYDTAGMEQGTAEVVNGVATISTDLESGATAIVKIGERSVKVMVK